MISTYTPTFLEKLLGRRYKWWYLMIYSLKSSTAYRFSNYAFLTSRLIRLASILIIWTATIQSGAGVFTMQEILTYYILGEIFFFDPGTHYEIGDSILDGSITNTLLKPTPILPYFIINSFGQSLFSKSIRTSIRVFLAVITYYLNLFILPNSFSSIFFFLVFFWLSFFILNFFSILTGSLAFWLTSVWGVIDLFQNLKNTFSGSLFPLNIFTWMFGLYFLPFSFTFYHPMQIYLGNYTFNQTLLVFLGGILWCTVLYFLAKWVFKMGLKRNESVGL